MGNDLIGYVQDVPGSHEHFLVRDLAPGEELIAGSRRYWAQVQHADGQVERVIRPLRRGFDDALWLDLKSEARANIALTGGSVELLGCVVGRYVMMED